MKLINIVSFCDENLASFRLRQLNIAQWINENSETFRVVISDNIDLRADINLFHKHFKPEVMLSMVETLLEKAPESKIIFDISDYYLEDPKLAAFYVTMITKSDVVTVSSIALWETVKKLGTPTFCIDEPFECQTVVEPQLAKKSKGKYVWMGHSSNLKTIEHLIPKIGKFLTVICNVPVEGVQRYIPWKIGSEELLKDYETVILPQPNKYKSVNRYVEALAAGCKIETFGAECYKDIEEDVKLFGRAAVLEDYTIESIGFDWCMVFEDTLKTEKKVKISRPLHPVLENKKYVRLNLGCGVKIYPKKEGWVNIDLAPNPDLDIRADVRTINTVLGDNVADEIHAYHVIEHIYPTELSGVLKNWLDVLKPGGKIVLELPDMVKAAKNLLQLETTSDSRVWMDLGLKAFYGEYNPNNPNVLLDLHKWAWTFKTLQDLMTKVGYVDFVEERPVTHRWERDFRLVAYKRKEN